MTPDKLKLLFALAHPGKCWHEEELDYRGGSLHICPKCGDLWDPSTGNPTFTTFAEIEGVMEGLIREGLWEEFYNYAWAMWPETFVATREWVPPLSIFTLRLFGKDESGKLRFFDLVAECPSVIFWY